MAMTEAHKQAIRDSLRARREKLNAESCAPEGAPNEPVPFDAPIVVADPVPNAAGVPEFNVSVATPENRFAVWLRSKDGLDCSDPRVPQDRVRFAIHLEDVLRKAYLAGYHEAEI